MSRKTSISDSEWVVMKVLWSQREATASAVVQALEGATDWKPKTIHTLMARLVKKGALKRTRDGREYVFTPSVSQEECQRQESQSFLARVFNGELKPFLASFLEEEKLSEEELRDLEKVIKQARKK